jgi:hypothetical protein
MTRFWLKGLLASAWPSRIRYVEVFEHLAPQVVMLWWLLSVTMMSKVSMGNLGLQAMGSTYRKLGSPPGIFPSPTPSPSHAE